MSIEESVVRRYWEQMNMGNAAAADELVSPEFVGYRSGAPIVPGPESERILNHYRAAFPDWTITVEDLIAEGDEVAVRYNFRGTHQQDFRFPGITAPISATGKQVTWTANDIYVVKNGKLVEGRWGHDWLGLAGQLGTTLSAPGG